MKSVNIAEMKARLSSYLALVEQGEEIQICRRNVPIARVVPCKSHHVNQTKLGCMQGSVVVNCDLTEPVFEDDWEMLKE